MLFGVNEGLCFGNCYHPIDQLKKENKFSDIRDFLFYVNHRCKGGKIQVFERIDSLKVTVLILAWNQEGSAARGCRRKPGIHKKAFAELKLRWLLFY